jgi:metal-sulfur cluster biosynthetic enzyme
MENFAEGANTTEMEVYNELKTVIDPEIGINIIDLGFVYKIEYNEEKGIQIEMTLSTKGCPMGDVILDSIQTILNKKFSGKKLNIQLIWEPAWSSDFVTPAGREALGI